MSASTLSVKVSLHNEMRRTSLDPAASFSTLKQAVLQLFKLKLNDELALRFQDEEGDWVTISSDEELHEAIAIMKEQAKSILHLNITLPTPPPPPPAPLAPAPSHIVLKYPNGDSIPDGVYQPTSEQLRHTILSGTLSKTRNVMPNLENYCEMWSHQSGPLVKPNSECLQKGRQGLKKLASGTQAVSSFEARMHSWCHHYDKARALLATKDPERVHEALGLFNNVFAMDDETNKQGVLYYIACCESFLGNYLTAITCLAKAVSAGLKNAALIETNPDFDGIRNLDHYKQLLEFMKTPRDPTNQAFLQYYLSTLDCMDVADEKEKYKQPVREAAKTQGKKI